MTGDLSPGGLLEQVRSGTAPPEVKTSLAKGTMPLGPAQMLEVLLLLAAEEEYRLEAVKSLKKVPKTVVHGVCASAESPPRLLHKLARLFSRSEETLEKILLNTACGDETVAFLAALPFPSLLEMIGRSQARLEREPQIVENLRANPSTPSNVLRLWEESVERIRRATNEKAQARAREDESVPTEEDEPPTILVEEQEMGGGSPEEGGAAAVEQKKETIQQILRTMTAGQKVALAGKGNGEVRKILIRDKNRLVAIKVLENPRITDSELEQYAKSTNVSDDVLRHIGTKREWMKLITVTRALVTNPKTPLGISMQQLKRMSVRELDGLSKNRNIPDALRKAAHRLFKVKSEKQNR
jgi:hypothetical protein